MPIGVGFEANEFSKSEDKEKDISNMTAEQIKSAEVRLQYEKENLYIPERRLKEIQDSFDCVVVNDYQDDYHLTDKERAEQNKFYKQFSRLSKCKKKYRRIEEFIDVYRLALKCLDSVANSQEMYPAEDFKKKVFKGKIKIFGLFFPKYTGKDRKRISKEYLSEFILSDTPSNEFYDNNDGSDIMSMNEIRDLKTVLFDEDELERVIQPFTAEEEEAMSMVYDPDSKEDNKVENVCPELTDKENAELMKTFPELICAFKDFKTNLDSKKLLDMYAYELSEDDYDSIAKYDKEHNVVSTSDVPVFTGDLMNDDDVSRYLTDLEEYEENSLKYNYNGKMLTKDEINQIELKNAMEAGGFNVRKFWSQKDKERRLKEAQRRDDKRAKKLKDKLTRINERSDRRKLSDLEEYSEKKKKKKKKEKKERKEKEKQMKGKKKDLRETQEALLMSAVGKQGMTFDEYKDEVEEFDWTALN